MSYTGAGRTVDQPNGKIKGRSSGGRWRSFLQPAAQALFQFVRGQARGVVEAGGLALAGGLGQDDGRSHGDVEALDHAVHGDVELAVGGLDEFLGDAAVFVAHDDGRGPGEVPLPQGAGRGGEGGGEHLHILGAQGGEELFAVAVAHALHPLAGRGRRLAAQHGEGGVRIVEVDLVHPEGVTGAIDGRDVVRVVDVGQDERQVGLPMGQHVLKARPAPGSRFLAHVSSENPGGAAGWPARGGCGRKGGPWQACLSASAGVR